jgi:formylglycine-generating enzyme required for sulfatase activity
MRRDEATGGRAAVRAGPSSAETGPSGRGTRRWRRAGLGGALGAAFGVAAVAVGLLAAVAAGDGWDAARAADSEALWPMLQTSASPVAIGRNDSALIVAIEGYSEVSEVPGAVASGRAWLDWLGKTRGVPDTRLKLLTDRHAINITIVKEAQRLAQATPEGGVFWLVFIGHGAPSEDGQDGVLVGYDAQQTADGLYARSVRRGELLEAIRKARGGAGGETVAILDACFSGKTATGAIVSGLQPLLVTRGGGRGLRETIASAGGADEFAGPLPGLGQPAFSYLLLGALSGWREADSDQDGAVSLQEGVKYARDALATVVSDRTQTPQVEGDLGRAPLVRVAGAGPRLSEVQRRLSEGAGEAEVKRVAVSVDVPGGRLDGGAKAVGSTRMRADIAKAAAYEAFVNGKKAALSQEREPSRAPADKAAAWARVVELAAAADNAAWQGQAAANASGWRKVEALRPGLISAWEAVSALLPLSVVPRADKVRMLTDLLVAYDRLGGEAAFSSAQAALRQLGEAAPDAWRAFTDEGGPGAVGAGLALDVNVAHSRWAQSVHDARAAAQQAEKDEGASAAKRAEAWAGLAGALGRAPADLPEARRSEAARQTIEANAHARSWRDLAARAPQAATEWAELRTGLALETVSLADKRAWVADFLGTFGQLATEAPVREARQAEGLLAKGDAFPLKTLDRASVEARRQQAAEAAAKDAPRGFVRVEPGRFTMGSPSSEEGRDDSEVQHTVSISRPFWLQATEVTQGQWEAVMGTKPSYFGACGKDCPVENVSWFDAVAYLNALSKREGLEPCYTMTGCSGRAGGGCGSEFYCAGDYQCNGVAFVGLGCSGYRLPTEAEWEYAARAGTTAARYGQLDAVGWYDGNSGNTTHRVASKQANAWGLHDMLGNVWEWVQDWYASYPSGAVSDPQGPASGGRRVYRGGGWGSEARNVRAANRVRDAPALRGDDLGLRAARSVP